MAKTVAAAALKTIRMEQNGRKPPALRAFLQADLQACKRNRKKCERRHVECGQIGESRGRSRGSSVGVARGGDHAGGDIDQKQPMPGPGVGDPAADHRPDRERQHKPRRRRIRWSATGCQTDRNSRKTAEKTAGISTPPAKPEGTRKLTSVVKPPLNAHLDGGEGKEADRNDDRVASPAWRALLVASPACGRGRARAARPGEGGSPQHQIGVSRTWRTNAVAHGKAVLSARPLSSPGHPSDVRPLPQAGEATRSYIRDCSRPSMCECRSPPAGEATHGPVRVT